MRTQSFENALVQLWIGGIALSIIGSLIGLYVLYLIIRWGVRDGMRDAQRGRRTERVRPEPQGNLPDMRAD